MTGFDGASLEAQELEAEGPEVQELEVQGPEVGFS